MLQRIPPAGFIAPCLPTKTDKPPSGGEWLHEIKHDGFRVVARKKGAQMRFYSRPGNDLTYRFPLIVETLERLRSRIRGPFGSRPGLPKTITSKTRPWLPTKRSPPGALSNQPLDKAFALSPRGTPCSCMKFSKRPRPGSQ
jgi:hypothetical protein